MTLYEIIEQGKAVLAENRTNEVLIIVYDTRASKPPPLFQGYKTAAAKMPQTADLSPKELASYNRIRRFIIWRPLEAGENFKSAYRKADVLTDKAIDRDEQSSGVGIYGYDVADKRPLPGSPKLDHLLLGAVEKAGVFK